MSSMIHERDKAPVLEAFDTLFNKRDYAAALRFWSPNCIQHSDWIVANVVRIAGGVPAEHWDVIQDEATQEQSKSGLPMFGTHFPAEQSPKE